MGQKESEIGQKTIAEQVEDYLDTHPVARNALQQGLVNYSALSRQIQKYIGTTKNFEAVLISVRRNAEKLIKARVDLETKIKKILAESNFEVRTKIAVLTFPNETHILRVLGSLIPELSSEKIYFNFIQGSTSVTFIIEQKYLEKIKKVENYVGKLKKNLAEIIIKSPAVIENVPGVDAVILNTFAEHGINIFEVMSCSTDTILIIDPAELASAIHVLEKLLKT